MCCVLSLPPALELSEIDFSVAALLPSLSQRSITRKMASAAMSPSEKTASSMGWSVVSTTSLYFGVELTVAGSSAATSAMVDCGSRLRMNASDGVATYLTTWTTLARSTPSAGP